MRPTWRSPSVSPRSLRIRTSLPGMGLPHTTKLRLPGDAWSDFLPGSKDTEADWVTLKCGNYNTKTKACSGQNYK